jgi:UTP--glucose-1-phosphate uridylyltransferase
VGNEPFGVILPDDIIDSITPCLAQLIAEFEATGRPTVALMEVPEEETFRYGVVKGERTGERSFRIDGLVEKPAPGTAPSNLVVIGRYILPPGIFQVLEGLEPGAGGEIQLTDALDQMAGEGGISGVIFEGTRFDSGNPLGFLQANIHYALKDPDMRSGALQFMRQKLEESGDV